jgi:hypothetical protein
VTGPARPAAPSARDWRRTGSRRHRARAGRPAPCGCPPSGSSAFHARRPGWSAASAACVASSAAATTGRAAATRRSPTGSRRSHP